MERKMDGTNKAKFSPRDQSANLDQQSHHPDEPPWKRPRQISRGRLKNEVNLEQKKSVMKNMENDVKKEKAGTEPRKVTFSEKPEIRYIEISRNRRESPSENSAVTRSFALSLGDEIISAILKWNPNWLDEARRLHQNNALVPLPPIIPESWSMMPVQNSYSTVESYVDTFKVSLLHEIWQKLFHEYINRSADPCKPYECLIVNITNVADTFKDFNVVALMDKDNVCRIQPNLLLTFSLVDRKMQEKQLEPVSFFGLILHSDWSTYRRIDEVTPELRKYAKVNADNVKRFCHVEMTIRARSKTNLPQFENEAMMVKITWDMSWMTRTVAALVQLKHNPLQTMILSPVGIPHPPVGCVDELRVRNKPAFRYDDSQLRVISSCVSALTDQTQPLVQLISGPGNSGKSQTVIGLIEELQQRRLQSNNPHGVLLVTAPTNESVDELCRMILALNQHHRTVATAAEQTKFLKFLRLGDKSNVAEDVAGCCLGNLVQKNMRLDEAATDFSSDKSRSQLTEKLAYLKGQLYSYTDSQLTDEAKAQQQALIKEMDELQDKLKSMGRRPIIANGFQSSDSASFLRKHLRNMEKQRERLILFADVIAFSLESNGSDFDTVKKLHWEGKIRIQCTIVDDACCATELESLWVLSDKLLLFGREDDPDVKRDDAVSILAKNQHYEASLFSRILSNFKSESAPVLRLNGQFGQKREMK